MGWIQSVIFISTCILLLQQSTVMVDAVPLTGPKALLKRGSSLTGKFLHITDIHIDPYYLVGSDPKKLCHSNGKHSSDSVGQFGALGTKCDSPTTLVQATFDFLQNKVQDIDFIIYTGDTVRHDRDTNLPRTQDDVLNGHKNVTKYFQSAYNIKNIPYIPTIGNNDSFDHDNFTTEDPIYEQLKSIWQPLGLNLTQDFDNGGYFVQDIIQNKLTVINLNSMYFFDKNEDGNDCDDSTSPGAIEMQWFENILQQYQAKKNGHQVYIMSHVPPVGDDGQSLYFSACYSQYLNLLGQYGSVISGHFTGHTNNDNLNAIISDGNGGYTYMAPDNQDAPNQGSALTQASMALFNAPSIIPANNPAVRVYTYDTDGSNYPVGTILDWDQYYVDLNAANSNGNVEFKLEYKASDLYGINHFDGPGVGQAVSNVANNQNSLDSYSQYVTVSSSE